MGILFGCLSLFMDSAQFSQAPKWICPFFPQTTLTIAICFPGWPKSSLEVAFTYLEVLLVKGI